MAVSKRLRYEVLRRDNHACRYCGAAAPEAKLTVDHVVPTALGGTDEASNLVAACAACNSGKSASAPDIALVEQVRDDAIAHAERMRQVYAVLVERIGLTEDYIDQWVDSWSNWDETPINYRESLTRWHRMGVPIEIVTDAARRASASTKWFRGTGRFTYMCGIVWNQITAVDAITADKAYLDKHIVTEAELEALRAYAWESGRYAGYRRAVLGTHEEVVSGA